MSDMYIIIAVVVIVAIAACGICLVIGSRKKKEGFNVKQAVASASFVENNQKKAK
jgi:hypothetical protein